VQLKKTPMDKGYSILILVVWNSVIGFSQDFKFEWQAFPSFSDKEYNILVEKKDTTSYLTIKETGTKDSISKKISFKDCDTLISFLDKYDFPKKPIKISIIYGPILREYFETKLLPDTNWFQVNGDSLRRELIWVREFYFDKDSNKCYKEFQKIDHLYHGHTYKGEYIKSNIRKTYSVQSIMTSATDTKWNKGFSAMDFKLNNIIFSFIIKYDSNNDYSQLKNMIEFDKQGDKD